MRKPVLTPEQEQQILRLYREWNPHDPNDNRNTQHLADQFGVARSTVERTLTRHNEPRKTTGRPLAVPLPNRNVDPDFTQRTLDAILEGTQTERRLRARIEELETLLRSNGIDFN